jgi:hypothetical protein
MLFPYYKGQSTTVKRVPVSSIIFIDTCQEISQRGMVVMSNQRYSRLGLLQKRTHATFVFIPSVLAARILATPLNKYIIGNSAKLLVADAKQ